MRSSIPISYLILGIITVFLSSCLKKDPPQSVQRSANRTMAVVLKYISDDTESARTYYRKILSDAVKNAYHGSIVELELQVNEPLQSPHNLYQIASAKIDDLFIFEVNLPPISWQPPSMPESRQVAREQRSRFSGLSAQVTGSIINGANLKTVGIIKSHVPWNFNPEFELAFVEIVKNASLNSLQNPNIYPQSDPLYFARILFDFSQKNEKDSKVALTCQTAQQILSTYQQAHELFVRAKEVLSQSVVVGQQSLLHDLNMKIETSKEKADILDRCRLDEDLRFSLDLDYGNIAPNMRPALERAVERAQLSKVFSSYTDKPVRLSFRVSETGNMDLNVFLRYHPERYIDWTKNKIPATYLNYHVISFDYFYPLMQYLIFLKNALPADSPQALKNSFRNLDIHLNLETLLSGQLRLAVAGYYIANENRVQLAFPKSVVLTSPGYEAKSILAVSDDIFREKGWMSVSSCQTIDGVPTEDGLLMKFMGLDCKI